MTRLRTILWAMVLGAAWSASANVISFNERFVLATDRNDALKELIPGTVDYYYYNALHLEHLGQLAEAKAMMDAGIKKHKHNAQLRELEHRYALKIYDSNPKFALKYIQNDLNLRFNHQQKKKNPELRLPTALKPEVIAFDRLAKLAFREHRNTGRFENSAFDYLISTKLNPDQRRDLLSRLVRPDYPGLVSLLIADLEYKHSRGFGSLSIHKALTITQLEECLKRKPEWINQSAFVEVWLSKLRPNDDVNLRSDDQAYVAYLRQLLSFTDRLPGQQISLKANVLYKQLEYNLTQGIYDPVAFSRYIRLPRPAHYVNRKWLDRKAGHRHRVDLNRSFEAYMALPPIGNDEGVVRRHLLHFLKDASQSEAYAEFIESNYLKRIFAESKLVNGLGDAEKWYALMDNPSLVKTLRDRVDLELLPTNQDYLGPNDPVALDVALKNIDELRIKIYEINTTGFYRQNLTEITTAIELDGLVPNDERVQTYQNPPMKRVEETLTFPEISEPGVYVIELIGNGVSSRAVIRRGHLTFTERTGAAGHAFKVFDDRASLVDDAVLWMGGVEYRADEGEIVVPYSGKGQEESIVFSRGDFSVLGKFWHQSENYVLRSGMYVNREQLVAGQQCSVTIRPELLLNAEALDLSLLENVRLAVRTIDLDALTAEKVADDFILENGREATYSFRVPERLRSVEFILSGEVLNLSTGEKVKLSTTKQVNVNQINETKKLEDVYLRNTAKGYHLELLGRNAEVYDNRALQLELKHRDFRRIVHASLKTDKKGRAHLGALKNIDWIKVKTPGQVEQRWDMPRDAAPQVPLRHMLTTEKLRIPVMLIDDRPLHQQVSFLETCGGQFVKDCLDRVSLEGGFLVLKNLSAGNYSLVNKSDGGQVKIRVTEGIAKGDQLLGKHRVLERKNAYPLQIQHMEIKGGEVVIQLAHASADTRVHVAMTRYVTDDMLHGLGGPVMTEARLVQVVRPESQYLSGRKIGDEYRYVMERKRGALYPGNMLTRPSMILNPWSPKSTETDSQVAQAGEGYLELELEEARSRSGTMMYDSESMMRGQGILDNFSCFDFLAEGSAMVTNLRPDKNGKVKVSLKDVPLGQQLHVYAVNDDSVVYRQRAVSENPEATKDLRLTRYLAPEHHFTEQKRSSIVREGETFTAADILSAKVEIVDSIPAAYRLLSAINQDTTFTEFNFITRWPDFTAEKKQELYKQYACHELHLFLAKKDPAFFEAVVRPYLASKKDATFMDDWLLGRALESYLEPWVYRRLNMVERILLAQQLKSEQASTARHLKDLFDLLPPDVEKSNRLFSAALRSSGLEEMNENWSRALREAGKASVEAGSKRQKGNYGFGNDVILSALSSPRASKPERKKREFKDESLMGRSEIDAVGGFGDDFGLSDDFGGGRLDQESKKLEDRRKRKSVRPLYRKLETTKEWVENNYYQQAIYLQLADLVGIDAFWAAYASWSGEGPFLSGQLVEAGDSFTEMMLALSISDLPFKAGKHDYQYKEGGLVFTAASDAIVFHKQVQALNDELEDSVLLINQRFFAQNDRYRYENNERMDKFVSEKFEKGRVYGCKLVLTNPTSTARKVDVLQQIPAGAIAVAKGMQTKSRHTVLEAYSTQAQEYLFYFPEAGTFQHFPVHVAQNEQVLAAAEPFVFQVVDKLDEVDEESWEYISQYGDEKQVLAFLDSHNINRLDLNLIAWRMRGKEFFRDVLEMLEGRKLYHETLWSYALYHDAPGRIREYLPQSEYAKRCGKMIYSALLDLDPIARRAYEHKEYWPLVNARVYKLGGERKILNTQFHGQYEKFMKVLSYRPELTADDRMAAVIYLLLQDRVVEALHFFEGVDAEAVETRIQYDYLSAYMAFYKEQPEAARKIAEIYKTYPVDRWRLLFADVMAQCDEVSGKNQMVVDEKSRNQLQTQLADTSPRLQLELLGPMMKIDHANLSACTVNYYPMDIELLFSRKPFVQDVGRQFSVIKPNRSEVLSIANKEPLEIPIPTELNGRNLMVEITGLGLSVQKAYYPNALKVELTEQYGHLRVADVEGEKALSKVYVKVYARMNNGALKFYKDGYTDLRGRFDYTSLNTNELDEVERFALLIMSDTHGAMVLEANPPKR